MIADVSAHLDGLASRLLTPRQLPDIVDFLEGRAHDLDGAPIPPLQLIDKDDPYRGPFNTENCPDIREILRSCVSTTTRRTVIVGPTQSFKTTILIGVEAYTIGCDHGPIGHVLPTEPLARAFSSKRFQLIAANTPWLAALRPSNPDLYKTLELGFATCTVRFAGSNSPGNLASWPYRRVIGDETDKFPQRIRNEAGTRELLQQRTGQFTHYNHIDASTPTVAHGVIWQAALIGTCERYYVPCHHCSRPFTHRFSTDGSTLVWDQTAKNANGTWDLARVAATAHYRCPHCQNEIWENHRRDMLHAGATPTAARHGLGWIPDPKDEADQRRADYEIVADPECRSFFRSCFNVLHPNRTYAAIAVKHLLAGRDPSKRQNFTNSELGEVYEEGGETIEADVLYKRRTDYLSPTDTALNGRPVLPDEIRVLTAACDVQASPARVEYEIVGWGPGMESWGIHYGIVEKRARTWQETFDEVDSILLQTWLLPAGHGGYMELQPAAIAWDTGHETEEVYKFVRRCQPRRVYAVKGSVEGYGAPLVSRPAKSGVKQVTLYQIGTVTAKCEIYSRMRLAEPGAGFMHYPLNPKRGYDNEYFRQLTAEKQMRRWHAGRETIKFVKPSGRRNEAIDIRCYNRAALHLLDPNFDKLTAKIQSATAQLELPVAAAPGGQPEVRNQKSDISHEAPPQTSRGSVADGTHDDIHNPPAGLQSVSTPGATSGSGAPDQLGAVQSDLPSSSVFDPATGRIAKADPVASPPPDSQISNPKSEIPPAPAVRPNTYELVTGAKPAATPRPNPSRIPRPRRSSWATRW
jgi:phage terminase large subunit GpA-like protein